MTPTAHPGLAGGPVYLDYNATTPVDPVVAETASLYLTVHFGNPSSDHAYGHHARDAVTRARSQLADLLGAPPLGIVFTGSGSEADNLAIQGVVRATGRRGVHIITQATEHPAILRTCRALVDDELATVTVLPVDADGLVQTDTLAAAIADDTLLVSVMHANNETGVIQPIAELAAIAHAHGALFHTDAAQTVGKIPVHVDDLDVDLLSVAGHKLYAPKGVGALYIRPGTPIAPLLHGGGQEHWLRAGTENVALITALGAAAQLAHGGSRHEPERQRRLRDRLHEQLRARLGNRVRLNGHPTRRLSNTLNVSIDGVDGTRLLAATAGVAASTGSACHSGNTTPSPVLTAMGVSQSTALAAIRLSVGRYTTETDVDAAAEQLTAAALRIAGAPSR
jgi:cysteine desulfurase